jgi:hydrogenase nickel incorporation protein HypA/HybF
MHELSITKSIIAQIVEEGKKNGIRPRTAVIELGALTGFRKQPILHYFSLLQAESGLAGCELDVQEAAGELRCLQCSAVSKLEDPLAIFCPSCDSSDIEITKGKDIRIRSLTGP